MEIKLNKQTKQTEALTIKDLINSLNLEKENIVVELNLKILKKENWEKSPLKNGDSVEIITFMGGG